MTTEGPIPNDPMDPTWRLVADRAARATLNLEDEILAHPYAPFGAPGPFSPVLNVVQSEGDRMWEALLESEGGDPLAAAMSLALKFFYVGYRYRRIEEEAA